MDKVTWREGIRGEERRGEGSAGRGRAGPRATGGGTRAGRGLKTGHGVRGARPRAVAAGTGSCLWEPEVLVV